LNAERGRLAQDDGTAARWRVWGPYLSERQWGTVREDYSADGNAWDYLPHDHARSRAYRWGEDGLAGVCDNQQRLCLSMALWNEQDPILKERLFGLTNSEGNHGEDVKELYYYLDATPTHSYLRMLYKYPQRAFPYADLVDENRRRGEHDAEYELYDTGVFDEDRYFDIEVEYAKAEHDDILMRITVHNRGPEDAPIHVIPQVWFRNTWSWKGDGKKPVVRIEGDRELVCEHAELGSYRLVVREDSTLMLCENETNTGRVFDEPRDGLFKDGFHEHIVSGKADAVCLIGSGTKGGARMHAVIPAGESRVFDARLTRRATGDHFEDFEAVFSQRRSEADAFYEPMQESLSPDERVVHRQAMAGMIWNKQFYYYDVTEWLDGDPTQPEPPASRHTGRNHEWTHLNNADILSMPDAWEYPWYAAWDLAFHCIPLAQIDPFFAKEQLVLLTREWYMHPNGQLPAYEWALGDVNPPVHAWATWKVFEIDRAQRGDDGDLAFLERVLHKLMLNFTWWVNRKDADGLNLFQGGFLGLDNIGVFDRSAPLPTGGHIDQADGTSWMAMYSLNLMRISIELARHNHVYEDMATKFFEHFLHIAEAMNNMGDHHVDLWDEQDQFFYDSLHLPDGTVKALRLRTLVGLIPLFAVEVLDASLLDEVPEFKRRLDWFLNYRPQLASLVSHWHTPGHGDRRLISLLRAHRMKRVLERMLDEDEFLSPFGVRSLSKAHLEEPYTIRVNGKAHTVAYTPGEADGGLFGGNSNWRGPVWFPVNYLIVESLRKYELFYGPDFKVECPAGSGQTACLCNAADNITTRLIKIFLPDENGRRPVYEHAPLLRDHPHFRDHLLFYEYFHGDSGRGVGASHQTGWTGLVATLLTDRAASLARQPNGKPPKHNQ